MESERFSRVRTSRPSAYPSLPVLLLRRSASVVEVRVSAALGTAISLTGLLLLLALLARGNSVALRSGEAVRPVEALRVLSVGLLDPSTGSLATEGTLAARDGPAHTGAVHVLSTNTNAGA